MGGGVNTGGGGAAGESNTGAGGGVNTGAGGGGGAAGGGVYRSGSDSGNDANGKLAIGGAGLCIGIVGGAADGVSQLSL
jgi:hypothetical protein